MKHYISIALSLLSIVSFAAWGQALTDPTRPPAGFYDAKSASGRAAYAPVRGLQSVIISPSHCAAIINGKTIVLGARYGSERLVEISERGVVLQSAQGRRVLTMFPGVAVKITESPASQKPPGKCTLEPVTHTKNPLLQDGLKEKK